MNAGLESGDHACQFFRTFDELKEVTLPFLKQGLEAGEACIYVSHGQSVDDWYLELQAYGVDVQSRLDDGSLLIFPGPDWRQTGEFQAIRKAREAWDLFEDLLNRHSGVRIAGNASWAFDPPVSVEQLCHWEVTAGLLYEGEEIRAICQYDLTRHSPAELHTALRTHPLAILNGRLVRNAFCEASRILENEPRLFASDADQQQVDAMLAELAKRANSS